MSDVEILDADLVNPEHAESIVAQLDAYSRDPSRKAAACPTM